MFNLGMPELLVILFIVFLIFGAKRLPEAGRGLGQAIRGFKEAMAGEDTQKSLPNSETKPPSPTV